MRRLFRPRNLLLMTIVGVGVCVVLSKRNAAPTPTYSDPWSTPASTPDTTDGEAAEAANGAASNGSAEPSNETEPATT